MPKSSASKRDQTLRGAAEKGKSLPAYTKQVAKELTSATSKKVARNR